MDKAEVNYYSVEGPILTYWSVNVYYSESIPRSNNSLTACACSILQGEYTECADGVDPYSADSVAVDYLTLRDASFLLTSALTMGSNHGGDPRSQQLSGWTTHGGEDTGYRIGHSWTMLCSAVRTRCLQRRAEARNNDCSIQSNIVSKSKIPTA